MIFEYDSIKNKCIESLTDYKKYIGKAMKLINEIFEEKDIKYKFVQNYADPTTTHDNNSYPVKVKIFVITDTKICETYFEENSSKECVIKYNIYNIKDLKSLNVTIQDDENILASLDFLDGESEGKHNLELKSIGADGKYSSELRGYILQILKHINSI